MIRALAALAVSMIVGLGAIAVLLWKQLSGLRELAHKLREDRNLQARIRELETLNAMMHEREKDAVRQLRALESQALARARQESPYR